MLRHIGQWRGGRAVFKTRLNVGCPPCDGIDGQMPVGLLHDLRSQGWARFPSSDSPHPTLGDVVLQTALALGHPIPGRGNRVVEILSLTTREDAPASSLSSSFGLKAFPFHNDNAHLAIPSRFVVLACVQNGSGTVPTYIVDAFASLDSKEKILLAKSAVFHVRNGRNSFYATILDRRERYIRFDPGCMIPQGPDAVAAMDHFSFSSLRPKAIRFDWRVGDVLVLDNQRMLHARGEVDATALDRTLMRCNVA